MGEATGVEARVCQDIADRQTKGVKKYGTTVGQNPLNLAQWLQHMYEELLDAAVYAKRAMERLQEVQEVLGVQEGQKTAPKPEYSGPYADVGKKLRLTSMPIATPAPMADDPLGLKRVMVDGVLYERARAEENCNGK